MSWDVVTEVLEPDEDEREEWDYPLDPEEAQEILDAVEDDASDWLEY